MKRGGWATAVRGNGVRPHRSRGSMAGTSTSKRRVRTASPTSGRTKASSFRRSGRCVGSCAWGSSASVSAGVGGGSGGGSGCVAVVGRVVRKYMDGELGTGLKTMPPSEVRWPELRVCWREPVFWIPTLEALNIPKRSPQLSLSLPPLLGFLSRPSRHPTHVCHAG